MPKYRITGPDGATYEVTAPDGATEQDVLAYAQANYQPKQADFSGVSSQAQTTADGRKGPLVPSATARAQPAAPSLESQNAANRAAMAAPGWQQRQDAETLTRRQDAFQRAPAPVRALAGAGGRLAFRTGDAALTVHAHASSSWRAEARASTSSVVVVSVTATTRPFSSASTPG